MNEILAMRDEDLPSAARRRRQFVLAVAAALVGVPMASKCSAVTADTDLLKQVLQALGHADEAVATTTEIDARLTRILREPGRADRPEFMDERYLRERIKYNIEADYRDGAIRVVDGWWLSHTEAECLELIAQVCAT